jgi:RHS repeat-associated protein
VKRRYGYGPTGEVLFDQVFDATVTTPSQSEQDLLLPLGDHQHSTRVVLAHDFQDATYVRQSLDYAQFGRVTATLGANGLADTGGIVTVYAHHGSLLDVQTGLQLKGERWYSPDLGRFVSEDPIQDGTNWFLFAGNDPVNYADPSGLSMQGHPLAGGYSGNVTRKPTISSGRIPATSVVNPFATTTFGGFVDAERGRQMLGLRSAHQEAIP